MARQMIITLGSLLMLGFNAHAGLSSSEEQLYGEGAATFDGCRPEALEQGLRVVGIETRKIREYIDKGYRRINHPKRGSLQKVKPRSLVEEFEVKTTYQIEDRQQYVYSQSKKLGGIGALSGLGVGALAGLALYLTTGLSGFMVGAVVVAGLMLGLLAGVLAGGLAAQKKPSIFTETEQVRRSRPLEDWKRKTLF